MASRVSDRSALPLLLVLAAALPVLLVPVTGMTDLPGHLARFRIMAEAGGGGAIDRWFTSSWHWIGNLGIDLPVRLLEPVLGVEGAARLAVAVIAPLTVLGILALSRAAHGRVSAGGFLALPLALSHAWYYGFVNYCLGLALALLVAAAWLRRPPRTPARALLFGLGALLVWTAHLGAWIVLLLLVAGAELGALRSVRALPGRVAAALPLLLPLVPLLAWRSGGGAARPFSYGDHPLTSKVMAFVTVLDGVERWFDVLTALAMLALGALALFWAGDRRLDARVAIAAVLVLLVTLAVPATVIGSWGTDLRMAPVAVLLALVGIAPAADPRRERALIAAGAALFLLRVGATTAAWASRYRAVAPALAVLDRVQEGSRLGYLLADSGCRVSWPVGPDDKLGAYAIVRRRAFANTTFHTDGADLVAPRAPHDAARWRMATALVPPLCPGDRVDVGATRAAMAAMAVDGFDTIWVHGPAALPAPPGFAVLASLPEDRFYRRVAPAR